jgi:MFS family permease
MFNAFSIRNFRIYWLGMNTLFFAGQLQMPAQAWLAYELTHSPLQLTLVAAMQSLPMILLSPFSGVIIDRVQKRDIILSTQIFGVAIAAVIAVLITTGHIQYWHLLLSSFLSGINWAFSQTARNAIIAELVPGEKLYSSIALNNAGANATGVAGPAISGILIGAFGVQGAYYAGIAFYVVGIIITSFLPATSTLGQTSAVSMGKNLAEGMAYLRLRRLIITILVMEMALTLFGASYQGLMPVFANLLNADSAKYGFMLAAVGIGSTLGSLGVANVGRLKRKGPVLLVAGVLFGIVLILFANTGMLGNLLNLGTASYYPALALLITIGICFNAYATTSNTVIQMNVDNEYRGRITSLYSMVIGFYPIGSLALGAIAQALGAPLALTISGGCLTVFMLMITFMLGRIRRLV